MLDTETLDSLPKDSYNDIARLAAQICQTPAALISFVGGDQVRVKSHFGLDPSEINQAMAICAHALCGPQGLMIEDLASHEHFRQTKAKFSDHQFLAAVPLTTPQGHQIGTLCVIDLIPRRLETSQLDGLHLLARQIMLQLELVKSLREQQDRANNKDKWVAADRHRPEKERLETIVNNIPVFLSIYDEQGHFVWANPAFENVLGWRVSEGQAHNLLPEFYPNPVKRQEVINFMSSPRQNEWMTFETHTRHGSVIPTSWMNVRLSSGHCISIGKDISIQRHQEKLIRDQQAKIVAAAKMSSLGEMAAGVAHEVNNPLTIILGNTKILKHLTLLDEARPQDITDACAKIDATVGRIAKIISGIKTFARDGSLDPFEKANLASIVQETLSFCEARFRNNRVTLTVEPFEEDLELECRSVQISQVLLNLLNNAFDAVIQKPTPWVRLEVKNDQHMVEIIVEDSGSGIPESIREKIMQPFFTTKEVGQGTGLGLSLSKGLIESHRGALVLDVDAANTRFRIRIPKKQNT